MKKSDQSKQMNGFTMIEMIIVVVIIGIAALIAMPMLSSAADMQVRSAANRIAADLDYAKSMAITHQTTYSVVFDTVNESYEIQDNTGTVIKNPVQPTQDYRVDFGTDRNLNRVNIATAVFNSPLNKTVTFDYLGCPYAGSLYLNAGQVTLRDDTGTFEININIEPMTGYVTISSP